MKFKLILILCIAVFVGCSEKNSTLTSPDGEITVNFTVDKNGIPRYNLVYKNDTIILDSRIGLNLKNISLDSALNVVSIDLKEYITTPFYNQEYNMPSIKYNELTIKFEKDIYEMDIICRAYNDGIAFRYWIRGYENVVISGDMTQVVLPEDSKVIWAPRVFNDDKIEFQTGSLQQIKETLIENDSTISDRNMYTHFQLLAETPSRKYMNFQIISGLKDSFLAARLDSSAKSFWSSVLKKGDTEMVITLPFYSKWHTISLSDNPADLLMSYLDYYLSLDEGVEVGEYTHPLESFKNSSSNNVYLPYFRHHKSQFIYSVLDSTSRSNSSLCHQLALNIIFNKPLSSSENYSDELLSKYKALEHFFKEIPLEWSNMKVLGAELGKYIIVARKDNNSSSWIVAGIMDEDSSQKSITFDFLDDDVLYRATIIEDDRTSEAEFLKTEYLYLRKNNTVQFETLSKGGFVVMLKDVKNP